MVEWFISSEEKKHSKIDGIYSVSPVCLVWYFAHGRPCSILCQKWWYNNVVAQFNIAIIHENPWWFYERVHGKEPQFMKWVLQHWCTDPHL